MRSSLLRLLWTQQRASVTIEFALAIPILLLMMMGVFEYGRALDIQRRMDRVTNEMGYTVIQNTGPGVSKASLDNLAAQAGTLFSPFGFTGSALFSSVRKLPGSAPSLLWQYPPGGNSNLSLGSAAILPGFTISDNENVIVVELRNRYDPAIATIAALLGLSGQDLYRASVFMPLGGPLSSLTP